MNAWQVARQLRALLAAAAWPDGSADLVLAEAHVSQSPLPEAAQPFRLPLALVRVGSAQADPQEPKLRLEQIGVDLVVALPGGAVGQPMMIGGPRASGQGSSDGRGLLELEEPLIQAVVKLGATNGVRLQLVLAGAGEVAQDERKGFLGWRGYLFQAWLGTARSYPPPTNLVATPQGSGNVALTWSVPPSRYDRLNVILRRASGSTPPASPSAGTGVTLSGALATSVTDSPGAGTFSYALFAGYDETSETPTAADRYSSAITRAGVVAT